MTPGLEKRDGSPCGNGVNRAARLQALADPAEVRVSQAVRDQGGPKAIARVEDAGERRLKHVAEPVKAWPAMPPGGQPAAAAASASANAHTPLRFGPDGRFELQPLERRLLVDGEPATLGARAFDLLLELAARPGALRTKHELIEAVWPGVVVEEGNLASRRPGGRTRRLGRARRAVAAGRPIAGRGPHRRRRNRAALPAAGHGA